MTESPYAALQPGDLVAVLREVGGGMIVGTVEKVARVNLTVRTKGGGSTVFRRDTGKSQSGAYRLGDLAEAQERDRRHAATEALRVAGLTVHYDLNRAPSTAMLERLAAVIREATE